MSKFGDRLIESCKQANQQIQRELLELAAKAAGLRVKTWDGHTGVMCALDDDRHGRMWMPLQDDGDALRLAVKLRLTLDISEKLVTIGGLPAVDMVAERCDADPSAATRRAIVRAAAAIGRAMP